MRNLDSREIEQRNDLLRRVWAKEAARYDRQIKFVERHFFGEGHRAWACSQAGGKTLEVAVGTGLNFPHYAPNVELTGIDLSPEMLAIARERATELGRSVDLQEGDALRLSFPDESFDTCVCTYSLCNVPDEYIAIGEMKRVLRSGGRLLLVDHVRSSNRLIFWLQRAFEFVSIRREGEHMTRRPLDQVKAHGFQIRAADRMRAGVIERVVALKPQQELPSQ